MAADRRALESSPGLALVWVGEDKQTAAFIQKKKLLAKKLDCQFFLHHFNSGNQRQLEAVIDGLSHRKDIHGIVLQLPLPKSCDTEALIQKIAPLKDVDNLRGDSPYASPTPNGIMTLLSSNNIAIKNLKTIILGSGKLVGKPLADEFRKNGWKFDQIDRDAAAQVNFIRDHDLLIAATGVKNLVTPEMVHQEMIVVDGSGVDVEVAKFEPLVKLITPTKGAIGPLTVHCLFQNLLKAAQKLV